MNKNKFRLAGIVFLLASINASAENTAGTIRTATAGPDDSTVVLISTGMDCKEDCKLVEKALYRTKGVKQVAITGDSVTVRFNPAKTSSPVLSKIIENTGSCEDPDARIHKVMIKPE